FISGTGAAPNKLLYCKNGKPEAQVQITSYLDLPEGTFVAMSIFGMLFALNLEETPTVALNSLLLRSDFDLFPENETYAAQFQNRSHCVNALGRAVSRA